MVLIGSAVCVISMVGRGGKIACGVRTVGIGGAGTALRIKVFHGGAGIVRT